MNDYALGQLARALRTADHAEEDAERTRADQKAAAWSRVLLGMANGDLRIGSHTPVRGLPAWVTPQVIRGGFVTGRVLAGGPLSASELAWAERAGLTPSRALLFGWFLTEPGLGELDRLLRERSYTAEVPEETALLTVAWLIRHGDRRGALDLLDTLAPFADRLRFSPRPAIASSVPPGAVFVRSAAEVKATLEAKRPQTAVEAQRRTLAVWNPMADRFLELWWSARSDGLDPEDDERWSARAADLLDAYDRAVAERPPSRRHRNPKGNLWILVAATRAALTGSLDRPLRGRLDHAVAAMVAKRGAPGSSRQSAQRSVQRAVAEQPSHATLARIAAARLGAVRADEGVAQPAAFLPPVSAEEGHRSGVPAGAPMPAWVSARVELARTASLRDLVRAGAVPSAEALARLVPSLTATEVGGHYADPALGALVATTYRAFRRRRSLLLLRLRRQVQLGELPWIAAVAEHAEAPESERIGLVRDLAAAALDAFPGTILPNALIRELNQLLTSSGRKPVLTAELAADIFMGAFSSSFTDAARAAGRLLADSIYARYYALDADELAGLVGTGRPRLLPWPRRPAAGTFAGLCADRAGTRGSGWSVAANGAVIEQAQILTTHNLVTLVELGARPSSSWSELAGGALRRCVRLVERSDRQRRALGMVKDAAYAWRQALFFLSLAGEGAVPDFLAAAEGVRSSPATGARMRPVLGGLEDIAAGASFDRNGSSAHGRRFLGWTTTGRHWITDVAHLSGS